MDIFLTIAALIIFGIGCLITRHSIKNAVIITESDEAADGEDDGSI